MTITVAVVGAAGKLGRTAVDVINGADDLELVAQLNSASSLSEIDHAEVVLDVTLPAVSGDIVEYAISHGKNVLVGTSGWSLDRIQELEHRVAGTPETGVVIVPNFSIGSALATAFAAATARFYDSIEIIEAHRASKVDSPSGTAIRTAELIGAARGDRGPAGAPHNDQRARGQHVSGVQVHSLRLDGVVARQETIFGGPGETLAIRHDTIDPGAYRTGILLGLRAAKTVRGVVVGLDKLIDLGIRTPAEPGRVEGQRT